MNDILDATLTDDLIERLQEWAENEPDLTGYGGKVLKEAITLMEEMLKENKTLHDVAGNCMQEMQKQYADDAENIANLIAERDELEQRIAELENDNQELANAIEETDKLNSERIAELEKQIETDTKICERNAELYNENKRLDAALGEIKEYFGRDFYRYYGLVEIYREAYRYYGLGAIYRKARENK